MLVPISVRLRQLFAAIWFFALLTSTSHAAAPTVVWEPANLTKTIGNGQGFTRDDVITLTATETLRDVDLWVTPELRRFVSVEPSRLSEVLAGVPYTVNIRYSIPPYAAEGTYDGTIHVRVGRSTTPRLLKVSVVLDYAGAVIPTTTRVITTSETNYLTYVTEDRLVFSAYAAGVASLNPGDVIVAGITPATPEGLLRKVDGLLDDSGSLVVLTSPATLGDAITVGSISLSERLTPPEATVSTRMQAMPMAAAAGEGFYIDFNDIVLLDADGKQSTTGDQLRAEGSLSVDPTFSLDLEKSLTDAEFGGRFLVGFSQAGEIELSSGLTRELLDVKRELASYRLSPVVVWVAFVPVVFQPVLSLNVGASGNVSVGAVTGVSEDANVEGGLDFRPQATSCSGVVVTGWCFRKIGQSPSVDFEWRKPILTAGFDARAYVGPQVSLLLYGLVGPYSELDGYLELDADLLRNPWWQLFGGLELGVGVRAALLGQGLEYYWPDVVGYRRLLAQADGPFANPNLVTYTFTGQVTQLVLSDSAYWSARGINVSVGTTFSGRFSYDKSNPRTTASGEFSAYAGALKSFEVTFNGNPKLQTSAPGMINHFSAWVNEPACGSVSGSQILIETMQIFPDSGIVGPSGVRLYPGFNLSTSSTAWLSSLPPLPNSLPSLGTFNCRPERAFSMTAAGDSGRIVRGRLTTLVRQ